METLDRKSIEEKIESSIAKEISKISQNTEKLILKENQESKPQRQQNECKICGKTFAHKNNFKVHMNNHFFGGKFKCNICNKGFSFPSKL